ncbi:toll/interleukin-1 receptor domain-containing protein [Xanthomonas euvesicatoria]
MKVFISWSGDQSRKYAEAIRDWLPVVLQLVTPYFTPTDVEKGARWSTDIAKELDSSQIGIICVTRDNLHADWVLFEAGALSKSLEKSHVCPVIFGISNTDLSGPLKQFQTTEFEKSEFHKLIVVINNKLGENKLPSKTLDTVFDKWWPDLQLKVDAISRSVAEPSEPVRSERDLIEEILILTRANARNGSRPSIPAKAIDELLNVLIDLHDDQVAEQGGYQDVLNIIERAKKPMSFIASKYKGVSSNMDESIEKFNALDYRSASLRDPEEDPDIPF